MTGFLVALIAVLIAGMGARDQLLVAAIAVRQPGRGLILVAALVSAVTTAMVAAWLALKTAPQLTGDARSMFAALALAVAAIELVLVWPARLPTEPTQSLGAFALVMFAQQLTDASRFLLFAIAVASATPLSTAWGGAGGAALVVALGWVGGAELLALRLVLLRRLVGSIFLALALWMSWKVRG